MEVHNLSVMDLEKWFHIMACEHNSLIRIWAASLKWRRYSSHFIKDSHILTKSFISWVAYLGEKRYVPWASNNIVSWKLILWLGSMFLGTASSTWGGGGLLNRSIYMYNLYSLITEWPSVLGNNVSSNHEMIKFENLKWDCWSKSWAH